MSMNIMKTENEMPKQWPATGQDVFNHLAKHGTSNIQIQAVIRLEGRLDEVLLKKAVRLSLDAEPILGCQFIEDEKTAYWQRFENLDKLSWFEFKQAKDEEEAVMQFLRSSFPLEGQQILVRLIRLEQADVIGVKINHAASDGRGAKDYLELLAEIYTKLSRNSSFSVTPDLEKRRDQKHYFDAQGISEPMALFNPQSETLPPTWAFPHHGINQGKMHIAVRRFDNKAFDAIKAFGGRHGVTLNTVILTAYYRSLFKLLGSPYGEEMEIYVTVDLRKFFGEDKKQAISNLSSFMHARLASIEEESFEESLKRTAKMIDGLKHNQAELPGAVVMEALGSIDFSNAFGFLQGARQQAVDTGKSSPLLSNIGIIPTLYFGEQAASHAYIVTPAMYAPGFMMSASTYQKTLTLEVSYCEPSHEKEEVELFLTQISDELKSLV